MALKHVWVRKQEKAEELKAELNERFGDLDAAQAQAEIVRLRDFIEGLTLNIGGIRTKAEAELNYLEKRYEDLTGSPAP